MSGFRTRDGSSPMKPVSSSSSRSYASRSRALDEPIPLIDCPQCGIPVIKLRSKNQETFYKCPNNFKDDDTCRYYWWKDEYVQYLRARKKKQLNIHEEYLEPLTDAADGSGETMRQEMLELRKEIVDVKLQMLEMKQQLRAEKGFVVNTSIVAAICIGVVFGVLFSLFWK